MTLVDVQVLGELFGVCRSSSEKTDQSTVAPPHTSDAVLEICLEQGELGLWFRQLRSVPRDRTGAHAGHKGGDADAVALHPGSGRGQQSSPSAFALVDKENVVIAWPAGSVNNQSDDYRNEQR